MGYSYPFSYDWSTQEIMDGHSSPGITAVVSFEPQWKRGR